MRGVQKLSASSETQHAILADLASNDLDPRVRLKAVEKVCDLSLLTEIINHEPDEIVRSTAQNRYYSLLAGTASDSSPEIVTGRYHLVDESQDEDLKKFIIHHSPDEKLQFIALQALADVSDVSKVSISAPNIKVREAAARMADQMANKVEPTPKTLNRENFEPAQAAQHSDTIPDELGNARESAKAKLMDELKIKPPKEPSGPARFNVSGNSLQIDEDSADALQALLDQKLAQRKSKGL